MAIILAGICSLVQHIQQLNSNPEAYRPERCPHCGCSRLWCHGCYQRHPERESSRAHALNPILIPRFLCSQRRCRKSCSVLPECIPPRRLYLWSVQQAMLLLLLSGRLPDEQATPHVRTVWRWWARLKARFDIHRFYLCSHSSLLGQYASVQTFWRACFARMSFLSAMFFIHQHDEVIP